MIDVFGPHSGYILGSYLTAILILGGMVASAWLDFHHAKARLARLESQKAVQHP